MCSNENDFQAMSVIDKIEKRLGALQNFRLNILNITKIDDFRNERNKIIKYHFELEDELRQCIYSLKSFLFEKKDLFEKINSTNLIQKTKEISHIIYDKDLNVKIQDLISVNHFLKEKIDKDEMEIEQFKETIRFYEDFIKRKQLELDNLEIKNKLNNYYNYRPDINITKGKYIL